MVPGLSESRRYRSIGIALWGLFWGRNVEREIYGQRPLEGSSSAVVNGQILRKIFIKVHKKKIFFFRRFDHTYSRNVAFTIPPFCFLLAVSLRGTEGLTCAKCLFLSTWPRTVTVSEGLSVQEDSPTSGSPKVLVFSSEVWLCETSRNCI